MSININGLEYSPRRYFFRRLSQTPKVILRRGKK